MTLADIVIPLLTLSGGAIGSWVLKPKAIAEARKARAEAETLDWNRFHSEIARLESKISAQDAKIAGLELDRDARAVVAEGREDENRKLRATVKRLEKRIVDLENIFKIHPITPEMQAELDKLK